MKTAYEDEMMYAVHMLGELKAYIKDLQESSQALLASISVSKFIIQHVAALYNPNSILCFIRKPHQKPVHKAHDNSSLIML